MSTWKDREVYFDKKHKPILDCSVIKVFHFIGARKKRHYMYKWVRRLPDGTWMARHLCTRVEDSGYWLRAVADENGVIDDTEVVQEGLSFPSAAVVSA